MLPGQANRLTVFPPKFLNVRRFLWAVLKHCGAALRLPFQAAGLAKQKQVENQAFLLLGLPGHESLGLWERGCRWPAVP